MQLFVAQRPDMREEELEDIKQFKKTTISCYLRCLDGRSCWTTLIRYTHTHSLTHTHTVCTHTHTHTHSLHTHTHTRSLSHSNTLHHSGRCFLICFLCVWSFLCSVPSVCCWRTMRTDC